MMSDQIISEVMEMSADISAWAAAFVEAQKSMGDVLKTKRNDHFKSKYAELADVLEAVQGPLNDNGFSVLQPVSSEPGGAVVRITTLLLHKSGQWVRSTLSLRPVKPDPQGVGSAITYGRRYGLMAMTGVAPEDDDGERASGRGNGGQPLPSIQPSHDAGKTSSEIEAELNNAETLPDLQAAYDRNAGRIAGLPDDAKSTLRKVYSFKQAAIREFSRAA